MFSSSSSMEERESTVSGSPGNSGTESPPAPVSNSVTQVAGVNVGTETRFVSPATITPTSTGVGGGGGTVPAPATTTGSSVDSFGKKKRGRPRKYDADGNLRLSYMAGVTPPSQTTPFSLSSPVSSPSEFSSSSKRGRGRPPGSGNWQLLASLGEF